MFVGQAVLKQNSHGFLAFFMERSFGQLQCSQVFSEGFIKDPGGSE